MKGLDQQNYFQKSFNYITYQYLYLVINFKIPNKFQYNL